MNWPTIERIVPPTEAEREHAEWNAQCQQDIDLFLTINHSNTFTSEDFRMWCLQALHRKPPHHGTVWGAMWRAAALQGKIEKTNEVVRANVVDKRHKRTVNVWRRRYVP